MNDRLELYREILDIEPNSKVFFTYAKLLEREKRIDEALSVLARGLESHPDYLEARLYYIDMLARNDKEESARLQLNRLTDIFKTHAGFWHIWSRLIAEENPTISTTLGLLATLFRDPSLSLLQILQAGVHAHAPDMYADDLRKAWIEHKDVTPRVPTLAEVKANDLANTDFSHAISVEDIETEVITITPEVQFDSPQIDNSEDLFNSQSDINEFQSEMPTKSVEPEIAPTPAQNIPHHARMFPKFGNANCEPIDYNSSAKISTLTKSMADLLADQGDIIGAIKIYEHHLDIAEEIEKPFIRSRLEYLYTLKNPAPLAEPTQHSPLNANISPRMQSMLSKLATRLENRV